MSDWAGWCDAALRALESIWQEHKTLSYTSPVFAHIAAIGALRHTVPPCGLTSRLPKCLLGTSQCDCRRTMQRNAAHTMPAFSHSLSMAFHCAGKKTTSHGSKINACNESRILRIVLDCVLYIFYCLHQGESERKMLGRVCPL